MALQEPDLPAGMERCGYSNAIDDYVSAIEDMGGSGESIDGTWGQFRDLGATAAYVSVYSDSPRSCTNWVTGGPMGHAHAGVRTVSSVVVEFVDEAAAQAAHRADVFGQSQLATVAGSVTGDGSGLGPNSAVAYDTDGQGTFSAVWQVGRFDVYLLARNLKAAEADGVAAKIHGRAGVTP